MLHAQAKQSSENGRQSVSNEAPQRVGGEEFAPQVEDNRSQTLTQRKLQSMADNGHQTRQLQSLGKIANSSQGAQLAIAQRNVVQRVVSEDEKNQLTAVEGQIDTALSNSILRVRTVVKFDLPTFVKDEYQLPRADIPQGNFAGLLLAGQRYLTMVNNINGLAAVVDFNRLVGTLGTTYQNYAALTGDINTQHQADTHDVFSGADPSAARTTRVDTKVKALNGKILEREGTTLETTIAGGVDRNRGAGPEVDSVHNMLSLMMLEVKKTTAVYKSPFDAGAGKLGAEWTIKAGTSSDYPGAKDKAISLSNDWVLHGHVSGVRGNRFSKKVTAMNADHFHLKDKDSAGGQDGPSIVVNTADVKAPAEAVLKTYLETINDKNNKWRNWIETEYIVPD